MEQSSNQLSFRLGPNAIHPLMPARGDRINTAPIVEIALTWKRAGHHLVAAGS